MPFPVLGSNSAVAEFAIDNSLRFNDDDGADLSRTPSSDGNRKTFTFSAWLKLGNIPSGDYDFFSANTTNNFNDVMRIRSDDSLQISATVSADTDNGYKFRSDMKFRDPSAWYHIVVGVDTTQATNSNGLKVYVNGSVISGTYDSYNQNISTSFNKSGSTMAIGHRQNDGGNHYDGYISEVHFIDGTQKQASDFGETNDNGVWIPKAYDGSYGTNGFKLEFKDSGNLGDDTSGNGNDFTATNLTATDQTTDTPTNNFCTLNPLDNNEVPNGGNHVYAEGNTKFTATAGNNDTSVQGTNCTMAVANGKWYWEAEIDVVGPNYPGAGILAAESHKLSSIQNGYAWNAAVSAYGYEYLADGQIGNNDSSTSSGWSAWNTAGKILMFALDMDNNKIYYGQNGTWDNSGDPTSGSTGTGAQSVNSSFSYFPHFHLRAYDGSASPGVFLVNFGNAPFSISSGNSDANGYGNFEYAVPSGYYSLCTKNLAEYG